MVLERQTRLTIPESAMTERFQTDDLAFSRTPASRFLKAR